MKRPPFRTEPAQRFQHTCVTTASCVFGYLARESDVATLQHAVAVADKPPGNALNAALKLELRTAVERAGLLRRVALSLGDGG